MFRRILAITGLSLVILLAAGYLVVAERMTRQHQERQVCQHIDITIADSLEHQFVSRQDVTNYLRLLPESLIGKHISQVDLHQLETLLESQGAINHANAAIDCSGNLSIRIYQRKPIARWLTHQSSFYIDSDEFCFPWSSQFTAHVPIITGPLPIRLDPGYRGVLNSSNNRQMEGIIQVIQYIHEHPFWEAQIQEIHVEENGNLLLFTRVGDQVIRFGKPEAIATKFRKLLSFYKEIVPLDGWNAYSEVDLRFQDQIVCTRKKQKKR